MRLKEPLYGIRASQGHMILHLASAITMLFLKQKKNSSTVSLEEQGMFSDELLEMMAAAPSGGVKIPDYIHTSEQVFGWLLVIHIVMCCGMFTNFFILVTTHRHTNMYLIIQFFINMIVNPLYITVIIYCLFLSKLKKDFAIVDSHGNYDIYEFWLQHEFIMFFSFIASVSVFLLYANIFKF